MRATKRIQFLLVAGAGLCLLLGLQAFAQDAAKTGKSKEAKILEKHPEADTDGDGTLSAEEIKKFMASRQGKWQGRGGPRGMGGKGMRGPHWRPDPAKVLEQHPELDTDGDGKLSPEEMKAGRKELGPPPAGGSFPPKSRMLDIVLDNFDKIDKDGNGQLSKDEITKFKAELPPPPPPGAPGMGPGSPPPGAPHQRMLERFPEADTDGDGKLSEEEMKAAREEGRNRMHKKLLERYPEADADGDGTLSEEEMKTFRETHRQGRPRRGERRR